jgi:hypothetical protein
LGLPPFDEALEPVVDFRDGDDPATDVGGGGRALWGAQDSSLDTSLSGSLSDSELDDACVLGCDGFFALLMVGGIPWLTN